MEPENKTFDNFSNVEDLTLGIAHEVTYVQQDELVTYTAKPDIIAALDTQLMGLQICAEKMLIEKLRFESQFKEEVVFNTALKNEEQRKISFEKKCLDCEPLQQLNFKLNENRWQQKKLSIDIDNQRRAFQLLNRGA